MVLVQGCRSSCALCVLGRLGLNQCLEVPCCAAGRAAAQLQVASSRVRWCHTSPAMLPAQPARGVPCCVVGTQSSAASRRLLEQAVPLWLCQASTGAGTAPRRAWWRHRHKLGWALRLPSKCSTEREHLTASACSAFSPTVQLGSTRRAEEQSVCHLKAIFQPVTLCKPCLGARGL